MQCPETQLVSNASRKFRTYAPTRGSVVANASPLTLVASSSSASRGRTVIASSSSASRGRTVISQTISVCTSYIYIYI